MRAGRMTTLVTVVNSSNHFSRNRSYEQDASKLANAKFTKNKLFLAPLITLFMVKFGAYVENVLKPSNVTKTTHTLILFRWCTRKRFRAQLSESYRIAWSGRCLPKRYQLEKSGNRPSPSRQSKSHSRQKAFQEMQ
jgi:hypothetical protein